MDDYQKTQDNNKQQFMELLKVARPEMWQIAQLLDDTQINPNVIVQFIYGLQSIAESTGFGNCVAEVENQTVRFIRAQNNRKLNEPLLITQNDGQPYRHNS